MKIKLNRYKNINANDKDHYLRIKLTNNERNKVEDNVLHYLNLSEQYDKERQSSNKYTIYGTLEYLSYLDGVDDLDSRSFDNLFRKKYEFNDTYIKTLFNSFYFYIVKPSNKEYEDLGDNIYRRNFEIVATHNDLKFTKQSFAKNVFGDSKYNYILNGDITVNSLDWFGLPVTELYLFCGYDCGKGNAYYKDVLYYNGTETSDYNTFANLQVGDTIISDKVKWHPNEYKYEILEDVEYKIKTYYRINSNYNYVLWKYKPFIKIKIEELEDTIQDNYDINTTIPNNAIKINNNYIWRNKMNRGYIDNLTSKGVDYPFINGKHYVFNNLFLSIIPDLSDINTFKVFEDVIITSSKVTNKIKNFNNNVCL